MNTQHFNATAELEKIRKRKMLQKRKSFQCSRLKKLRTELVLLRKGGASYREIALWLRQTKRIKTTHTTDMRFLEKLPELRESGHA